MANYITFFVVTWCIFKLDSGAELEPNCTAVNTCGQCLRNFGCAWCADPDQDTSVRCQDEKSMKCSEKFIINPKNSIYIAPSKQETTSEEQKNGKSKKNVFNGSTSSKIISVTPQVINITLRPNKGHPLRIKMRYHHAPDYPLDIYYLMDLSGSLRMSQLTLSLGKLGAELKEKVSKITRDLQLGFGSFVEKPVHSFINHDSEKAKRACPDCIQTYSFRNHLSLTNNTRIFSNVMNSLKLAQNVDSPESGLDGIMQSLVCHEKIGWRNHARKLLVYSSDGPFHIAGDGKLSGILKPNDGCCHLNATGYYSESTNQDYPSITHIQHEVRNNAVNLIFTVPKKLEDLYQSFADLVEGAFVVGKENYENYDETLRIITEQYEKISSKVELEARNLPKKLEIGYYSKCGDANGPLSETTQCEGLKINDSVEFELQIELLACPSSDSESNRQFYIQPLGVPDFMTVNLKMWCDCECDRNPTMCEQRSSKCSGNGDFEFGVCRCVDGYTGPDCSCSSQDFHSDTNCREMPGFAICSGRGTCECNKCHCESSHIRAFGKFCECSNSSCPLNGGKLCSGHGTCNCNKCQCDDGWTADDCSCETEQNNCRGNLTQEICSSHGVCVCNKCVCDPSEGFSGNLCEKLPTGKNFCNSFDDCVLCLTRQNEPCADICKGRTKLVEAYEDLHQEENICTVSNDQNCKYRFSYKIVNEEFEIFVLREANCDFGPASISKFVIGVISAIVLIGFLFLMMWKMFVVYQDRKEFSKFIKEQELSMWENGENPLYLPASKKYRNPLFEEEPDFVYKGVKKD